MITNWYRKSAAVMTSVLLALLPALAFAQEEAGAHHVHIATSHTGEAVRWYVEHLPCEAIADQPDAIRCGAMEIEFIARPTLGSSQGTGVDHIGFSFPDLEAKMAELEDVGVRGSGVRLQRFEDGSTLQTLPGLGAHGFVFDPWGTRIELIQDPEINGFHHVHLSSADPDAVLAWYADIIGGERAKFKNSLDGLRFDRVWLLVGKHPEGRPAATDERAIDHLGFVVAGLDQAVLQMSSKGVDVHGPVVPENARAEAKRAFIAGPDGVLLAVVEPGWAGVDAGQLGQAQSVASAEDSAPFSVPLTPWGEPDLQGIWTGNSAHGIPLEKPEEVADTGALTPEEAAARRERGTLGSIWGYEREWRDTTLGYVKSAPSTQAAMIIDPPDGRMPPMTEKGQALAAAALTARENPTLAAGPEDLSTYVRCITRGLPGLMMPSIYNNGLQIVQSPGNVAIQKEMIHETRIIPITDRPHLGIKQWLGSSRGHWEGDTLVVEVQGFNGRAPYQGAGENLKLTESYRLVAPNRLEYRFTVDDPTIWTAPWTGMFHFDKDDAQYELVEYACHEGNYGMTNILSAARAKDARAKEASSNEKQSSDPAGD